MSKHQSRTVNTDCFILKDKSTNTDSTANAANRNHSIVKGRQTPLFFLYEAGSIRKSCELYKYVDDETHHYGLQEQENILRQEGH